MSDQAVHLNAAQGQSALISNGLNSFPAISSLSNDELLAIFRFLLPDMLEKVDEHICQKDVQPSTKDIRSASQVCRSWRNLALGYTVLWSQFNCTGEALSWLEELVRRSCSTPVHIFAKFPSKWRRSFGPQASATFTETMDTVLSAVPSIASLSIFTKAIWWIGQDTRSMIERWLLSASLTSLVLHCHETSFTLLTSIAKFPSAQSIRHLDLKGCRIGPCLTTFRHLHTLYLSRPWGHSLPSTTSSLDWVHALSQLPELVHLKLDNVIIKDRTDKYQAARLDLPRLQTLALRGNLCNGIDQFLSAMSNTHRYSLLLVCSVKYLDEVPGTLVDPSIFIGGLERWFNMWYNELPSSTATRRISLRPALSRLVVHNQIKGGTFTDQWFRISLDWKPRTAGLLSPRHRQKIKVEMEVLKILQPVLRRTTRLMIWTDEFQSCPTNFWQPFESVEVIQFVNSKRRYYGMDPLLKTLVEDTGMSYLHLIYHYIDRG